MSLLVARLTHGDDAHRRRVGAGAVAGQLVGRGSKSTEETAFGTALLMTVIYVAFEVLGSDSGGGYVMDAVMQALLFGVGVARVLFGVRTILGEIVPAFQGIAQRIVPGAMPAPVAWCRSASSPRAWTRRGRSR